MVVSDSSRLRHGFRRGTDLQIQVRSNLGPASALGKPGPIPIIPQHSHGDSHLIPLKLVEALSNWIYRLDQVDLEDEDVRFR